MHNINIFYVAGMYGSTIDYILQFTQDKSLDTTVLSDGSMHAHIKNFHVTNNHTLQKLTYLRTTTSQMCDIIYPWSDKKFNDIISLIPHQQHKNILVHANNLEDCELTLLNQYYKIAYGKTKTNGLEIFEDSASENFKKWNECYTSWQDMQTWEWREWFSFTYPGYTSEWIASQYQSPDYFFKLSINDLLYNTVNSVINILNHCQIPISTHVIDFATNWKHTQQHIINKLNQIDCIVESILEDECFEWKSLSIIEEAIIQTRLRKHGFELACDGLNKFPCTTKDLKKVLYI